MAPLKEIPFGRPMIGEEERTAVMKVLNSPQLVHGPVAKAFETAFAASLGQGAFATCVSSCTAGLHLAYMHYGLGPGDEVIVPAETHVATAHAVEITGARPVFVDCDSVTGNIDVPALEDAVNERTRAISVVHYLGLPVNMAPVVDLARKRGLFLVEDCALAVGARVRGVACGLLGDVGVFSFYPAKHMTTGEGGMVVSRHADLIASIANLKAFGYDRTLGERKVPGIYDIVRLGINYRMNEISAAIGLEQLNKLPTFARRRTQNTRALRESLAEIDELTLLAEGNEDATHANYCLVGVFDEKTSARRSEIIMALKERGIGTSVHYPVPVPLSKYYKEKYGADPADYPNALRISNCSIALPVGPHLDSDDMRIIANELMTAITRTRS